MADLVIPLPPLAEQQRIVAILDEAFAGIDKAIANTERNLANAKELFESYLNSVFANPGEDWEERELGALTTVQSGGTPSRANNKYWDGSIPWYSSGELNAITTLPSKEFITKLGLESSNAKLFPIGSLLIGMYDTAAMKMSILDREAAFNQAIAGVMPSPSLNMKYAYFALSWKKADVLLLRRGVRQKNLNLSKIQEISIPLPSQTRQTEIVDQIEQVHSKCSSLHKVCEEKLSYLRQLKQSILQKAFTGALTAQPVPA